MKSYSKKIKKLIRDYNGVAYEAELKHELRKLHVNFEAWRDEDITGGELSELIYKFTKGPSRALYLKYNGSWPDLNVAQAIVSGILEKDEMPSELIEGLGEMIKLLEERGV